MYLKLLFPRRDTSDRVAGTGFIFSLLLLNDDTHTIGKDSYVVLLGFFFIHGKREDEEQRSFFFFFCVCSCSIVDYPLEAPLDVDIVPPSLALLLLRRRGFHQTLLFSLSSF